MKRSMLICVFAAALLGGCCSFLPRGYVPQPIPPKVGQGAPLRVIDLTGAVADKVSVAKMAGLFSTVTVDLPLSLAWLQEDALLLQVLGEGGTEVLHAFRIDPNTGAVRQLAGAEKDAVQLARERQFTLVSRPKDGGDQVIEGIVTTLAVAAQAALAVFGGGVRGSLPEFGEGSTGRMEQPGATLHFGLNLKQNDIQYNLSDHIRYTLTYTVKNERTGSDLKGRYEFGIRRDVLRADENKALEKTRTWLRSWRVSPDGSRYLIGESATYIDPGTKTFTELIGDADGSFRGLEVSPRWDRVALLRAAQDPAAKRRKYRLEVHLFDPATIGKDQVRGK